MFKSGTAAVRNEKPNTIYLLIMLSRYTYDKSNICGSNKKLFVGTSGTRLPTTSSRLHKIQEYPSHLTGPAGIYDLLQLFMYFL